MTPSSTETYKIGDCNALHIVVFVIAMISFMLNSSNARAATAIPSDYRVTAANDKFADTWQSAVAFRMRPPRRLRARRLELAIGAISTSQETRAFVSFGPVWRLPINSRSLFVELGFSPTLISGSSFNGRDMGGNFHFTSSATAGVSFGARDSVPLSLRIQHMSNGSLSSTNPGMNMIGLNFAFDFNEQ